MFNLQVIYHKHFIYHFFNDGANKKNIKIFPMKEYNILLNNSPVRIRLNKAEVQRNKLVILFSNSVNFLSNIVNKILEKRKYKKIQLMIKYEDMININILDHRNILENIYSQEYNPIYNFDPTKNFNDNDYVKFYELIRNE